MPLEKRTCKNCKNPFIIEPADSAFYQKMKVPPPTWCPECRLQRRLSFLNFINFYKRQCGLCKKDFISNYHSQALVVTYCPLCWWSDKWDPREYGKDYDFSRPFFAQFRELWQKVPVIGMAIDLNGARQSPYNNYAGNLKQCYLLTQTDEVDDSAYGVYVFYSKGIYDSSLIMNCDTCFDSMHCYKVGYGVGMRNQVYETSHSAFLRDCHHCQNCFASANLRGKQYYIFNKPYTKEEYFVKIKEWDLGSYQQYQEIKKLAEEHWEKYPPKTRFDEFTVDCTGNSVFNSKNCRDCYEVNKAEDSRYLFMVRDVKDSYDISMWGEIELCYEGIIGRNAANVRFGVLCAEGAYDTEYSVLSHGGATNNFGCVSMRNNYCIFNKQYAKEEYFFLVEKIRKHMTEMPYEDSRGRVYPYGEFFPPELSPHGYNESVAQHRFPLSEEEAKQQGLPWFPIPVAHHKVDRPASDLPDHIQDASDTILQEVIGCTQCGKGYKIIPQEFAFLRQNNFPLPRRCPHCRIKEKLDLWMTELKNIHGTCEQCGREVECPSSLQGQKILCGKCYQKILE